MTKLQAVQTALGVAPDNKWGGESQAALDDAINESRRLIHNVPFERNSWPWKSRIDGDDVVVDLCRMTCFGGSDDPQDGGATASGISTKDRPDLAACSLPMDGRAWGWPPATHDVLTAREHLALDGSPIPRVPFKTMVRVTVDHKTVEIPVIDLGPGRKTGNALDLTIAAARLFDPKASARSFEARGSYRVLGAAKYVKT